MEDDIATYHKYGVNSMLGGEGEDVGERWTNMVEVRSEIGSPGAAKGSAA